MQRVDFIVMRESNYWKPVALVQWLFLRNCAKGGPFPRLVDAGWYCSKSWAGYPGYPLAAPMMHQHRGLIEMKLVFFAPGLLTVWTWTKKEWNQWQNLEQCEWQGKPENEKSVHTAIHSCERPLLIAVNHGQSWWVVIQRVEVIAVSLWFIVKEKHMMLRRKSKRSWAVVPLPKIAQR